MAQSLLFERHLVFVGTASTGKMSTAVAPPAGGGFHFAIPEGTASITQPDWDGEGHDSWGEWGMNKEELTSVTIPTSVIIVGQRAFYGCFALTSAAIPPSVTSIEQDAFWECSSLTSVDIPTSVTSIESWTFFQCSSLTTVAIPASVTSIKRCAFEGCSALTRVDIPTSVSSIEECAFHGCSALTCVAIPTSVTSIEGGAFENCSVLTSVEIPASVTTLGTVDPDDGVFYGAFEGCTSLAVLMVQPTIPNDDDAAAADAATSTTAAAATTSTSTIIKAFNEQNQFPAVTKIWATDDVVKALKGRFEAYNQFKDVPRALRAAPDAKAWAGVQLWLWWLPPTSFAGGGDRVVCKTRKLTTWVTMLSGLRAEESSTLPRLPEELWLYTFGFVKHDQQPTFLAQDS